MTEVISTATDPVCGMRITKTETPYTAEFGGAVLHFCSAKCKARFEAAPMDFIGLSAA